MGSGILDMIPLKWSGISKGDKIRLYNLGIDRQLLIP